MSAPSLPRAIPPLGVLSALTCALLLGGCGPAEQGDCPEPGDRPFSLTCDGFARECRSEQMQQASLGPLIASSEAVAVVPWGDGVLRVAPTGQGNLEAQPFDQALFALGAPVALRPSAVGVVPVAVRAVPVPDGAVVVILEHDVGTTRYRLLGARLVHGQQGHPEPGAVESLWEGAHFDATSPELYLDVDGAGETLVVALGTSEGAGMRRLQLVRAELSGQRSLLVRELPFTPGAQTLPAGITLLDTGSVLLAGIDVQGEGGTLWVDHLDPDLRVVETVWTVEQERVPTSTALIPTPGRERAALGWFMPSPGEGEFAGMHRLEEVGPGSFPTPIDIWLGSYFGPHDGGELEQALAFEGDQLVQVSLELGEEGAGSPTLLGFLRMDVDVSSYNPWEARPPLRVPVDDHRLDVHRLPHGGILATVPLLEEEDGSASLGLFRICLPL